MKFTRQNAGECSSENSSKQNFPGCMPPPPSQTSRLRFCNECIGQILGLNPALLRYNSGTSLAIVINDKNATSYRKSTANWKFDEYFDLL